MATARDDAPSAKGGKGDEDAGTALLSFLEAQVAAREVHKDGVAAVAEYVARGDEVVPLEWVVDVADRSRVWAIGTATGYHLPSRSLEVAIPDALAPQWQGRVALDPGSLRLIEAVDTNPASQALFRGLAVASDATVNWVVERTGSKGNRREVPVVALRRLTNSLVLEDGVTMDPAVVDARLVRFLGAPMRPSLLLRLLEEGHMRLGEGRQAALPILQDLVALERWEGPLTGLRTGALEARDFVEELRKEDRRTTMRTHHLVDVDFQATLLADEDAAETNGLKIMKHAERVAKSRHLREEQIQVDAEYMAEILATVRSNLARVRNVQVASAS